MNLSLRCGALCLVALLGVGTTAQAQQANNPHIGYVYPAGGQQGATIQVVVGGQFLKGVDAAYLSGAGVHATVLEYDKPLTRKQAKDLQVNLKELMAKRRAAGAASGSGRRPSKPALSADDLKTIADIRKKLATYARRPSSPAIAESAILQVMIAADADPGMHELRLRTPAGVTDPLCFCVGQLPEVTKPAATAAAEPTNPVRRAGAGPKASPAPSETTVTLPTIVNGQIMPGAVDRYRFKAVQGEKLVIAASAQGLIPYLADAVPGWFQATLTLYDAAGNEVAYDDDYRFHPDPVIFYKVPKDGDYVVAIKDAIYRGREDFVYRISMGEIPFITSIFPLGGPVGAQTAVQLTGWNLPVTRVTQDFKDRTPGVYPVAVAAGNLLSNQEPFAADTLPERMDQGPNHDRASALGVTLPVIVNGRITTPGTRDVFRLECRAREEIVAEVYARRLDSPLDSYLKLTDATGKELAFNDDFEDKAAGLVTHQADSYLRVALPASGSYYLYLGDTQSHGGPEYAYRLRISHPQPDFELRVTPSSFNGRTGMTVPITVYAIRRDGFAGEINLSLKGDFPGFTLSGARVPPNQDQVRCTLTCPAMPIREPANLTFEGRATIDGKDVVRPGVPAEHMMQAFAYYHLVPAAELMATVTGRYAPRAGVRILSPTPVRIPAGGTATILVGIPVSPLLGAIELDLSDPPDGITIKSTSSSPGGTEIVLQCDAAKVKPGLEGNLIIDASLEHSPLPGSDPKKSRTLRIALGVVPAVPFVVVSR